MCLSLGRIGTSKTEGFVCNTGFMTKLKIARAFWFTIVKSSYVLASLPSAKS